MEKNNNKSVNYIGMFDLLKGVGMLLIILGHTVNNYTFAGTQMHVGMMAFGVVYILVGAGVLQAFFLISGYGFRRTSIRSCIKKQTILMLKPYMYITIGTAALHIFTRYLLSHSIKSAIEQTWSVLGGFIFALPSNKVMFGTQFYSCGAMWYMIALLIGWILLNTLMNLVKERYLPVVVWGCAVIGWLIGMGRVIPFCVSQGLIAVLFLYYGYMLKKKKVFAKSLSKAQIAFAVFVCALSLGLAGLAGEMNNMANGVWIAGIISIALDGYIGFILLYLSLKLNSFKGRIWEWIKKIGSNSLYIFTMHTVEMHGIPWWKFTEYMKDEPVRGCVLHFVMRCTFIVVGAYVFKKIVRKLHKRKALRKG